MNSKEGYVYILTNPSFIANRIKIGKTKNELDLRSKQLFNTSIPTPFKKYASIKTMQYSQVESSIHEILDLLTDTRVNEKREFFDVAPEVALKVFLAIAKAVGNATVFIYGDDGKIISEQVFANSSPDLSYNEVSSVNEENMNEDCESSHKINYSSVPSGTEFSMKGISSSKMGNFTYSFVSLFLREHPLRFAELKEIFKDTMLEPTFQKKGFLVEYSQVMSLSQTEQVKRYAINRNRKLISSDKYEFFVNNQWTHNSFSNVIKLAQEYGYKVNAIISGKEETIDSIKQYTIFDKKRNKVKKDSTSSPEIKKNAKFSIDGSNFDYIGNTVRVIVKEFIRLNPSIEYKDLKDFFSDDIMEQKHVRAGFLCSLDDLNNIKRIKKSTTYERYLKDYHANNPDCAIRVNDVTFYTNDQWTRTSFLRLVNKVKSKGIMVYLEGHPVAL